MKESTAKWLAPMQEAARERGIDMAALMARATMPIAEADGDPLLQQFLQEAVPDANHIGVDWIRFGDLLREELGWADYPQGPDPDVSPS